MSDQETEVIVQSEKERSKRAVLHVAELWVAMAGTDAWQQLEQELTRQSEKQKDAIYHAVLEMSDPVDQFEISFARGVIEGISRPFQVIETARKVLEKRDKPVQEPELVEEEDVW